VKSRSIYEGLLVLSVQLARLLRRVWYESARLIGLEAQMKEDAYNKPWEYDRLSAERFSKFIDGILRDLETQGYGVGSEMPLTLELVTSVLHTWHKHTPAELKDDESMWDDADDAYKVFERLLDKYANGQVVLNREFIAQGVIETSDEIAIDEFMQDYLKTPNFLEDNNSAMSSHETDRLMELGNQAVTVSSRAGDHQLALKLLAYVQERCEATHLSTVHSQRADVFEGMGNLSKAITEARRAAEWEIESYGLAAPDNLYEVALLEFKAGHIDKSLSAIRECIDCVERWSHLPLQRVIQGYRFHYVLKSRSGNLYTLPEVHMWALKGVIALVEKIDTMSEFADKLKEIKTNIVKVREVIEEHLRLQFRDEV